MLIWNGVRFYEPKHHHFGQRSPLSVAISDDAGSTWKRLGNIEDDPDVEYTNIGCTFTTQGDALITYWTCSPAFTRKAPQRSDACIAVVPASYWKAL